MPIEFHAFYSGEMESSNAIANIQPNVNYVNYVQHADPDATNEIVVMYVNICSATGKWDSFTAYLSKLSVTPDIIVMVETWLNDGEEKFFNLEGFTAFHCVREKITTRGRGGGTAIFVRDHSTLHPTLMESIRREESTIIVVKLTRIDINIIAIYRPEQMRQETFRSTLSDLISKYKRSVCIGDFNINIRVESLQATRYIDMLLCHGFAVLNSLEPSAATRQRNTIDHISTDLTQLKYILSVTDFSLSDHRKLLLTVKLPQARLPPPLAQFQVIDHNGLEKSTMWEEIASCETMDVLHGCVSELIDTHRRTIMKKRPNAARKPWITAAIIELIERREFFFKYMRRHPQNDYISEQYYHYKRLTRSSTNNAKRGYFSAKLGSGTGNPKQLWRGINEIVFNRTDLMSTAPINQQPNADETAGPLPNFQ